MVARPTDLMHVNISKGDNFMDKQLNGFLKKIFLMFFLTYGTYALAVDPAQGPYGGVIIGGSYAFPISLGFNNNYVNYFTNNPFVIDAAQKFPVINDFVNGLKLNPSAKITYSFMGLLGGQLGYRYENFRAEAQFLYNSNSYDTLNISTLKLTSRTSQPAYISGQSNVFGGFVNFYYDLLPPSNVEAQLAPFAGFGIGYIQIQNNFHLHVGTIEIPNPIPNTSETFFPTASAPAGQLIGGLLYFLDDFSFFGLDCRVLSSANITNNSLATDYKTYRYQLLSVNLSFNGSFDLG